MAIVARLAKAGGAKIYLAVSGSLGIEMQRRNFFIAALQRQCRARARALEAAAGCQRERELSGLGLLAKRDANAGIGPVAGAEKLRKLHGEDHIATTGKFGATFAKATLHVGRDRRRHPNRLIARQRKARAGQTGIVGDQRRVPKRRVALELLRLVTRRLDGG